VGGGIYNHQSNWEQLLWDALAWLYFYEFLFG
jgi:hypothetical protein